MQANPSIYFTVEDVKELYEKHLGEIIAFIYNYLKNEDDALDLAQDIFYKLYNEVTSRKIEKTNPRAYLYRTARNHCIDKLRRDRIRWTVSINNTGNIPEKTLPEEKIVNSLVLESIFEYIEKNFSEVEKTVFRLRYAYGFNLEEISEVVDSSVSTLSRILARISRNIEEKFPDILDQE